MTKTLRKSLLAVLLVIVAAMGLLAFTVVPAKAAEDPNVTAFHEQIVALKEDCADTQEVTIDAALAQLSFANKALTTRDAYNQVTDKSAIAAEDQAYYDAVIKTRCESLFIIADYNNSIVWKKLNPAAYEGERLYLSDKAAIEAKLSDFGALKACEQTFVNNLTKNLKNLNTAKSKLDAMDLANTAAIDAITAIQGVNLDTKALENFAVAAPATHEIVLASKASIDNALAKLNKIYDIPFADIVAENAAAKDTVTNYQNFLDRTAEYKVNVTDKVQAVVNEIDGLMNGTDVKFIPGEVCYSIKDKIETADAKFNALPKTGDATYGDHNDLQSQVTNKADLTTMTTDLAQITSDIAAVVAKIGLIDATVVQTPESLAKITEARTDFDKLDKDVKTHDTAETAPATYWVSNYTKLTDAEVAHKALVDETNALVQALKDIKAVFNPNAEINTDSFLADVKAINDKLSALTTAAKNQDVVFNKTVFEGEDVVEGNATAKDVLAYYNGKITEYQAEADEYTVLVDKLGAVTINPLTKDAEGHNFAERLALADAKYSAISRYAKELSADKKAELEVKRGTYNTAKAKADGVVSKIEALSALEQAQGDVAGAFFAMKKEYDALNADERPYVDAHALPEYKGFNTCEGYYGYFLDKAVAINTEAQAVIAKIAALGTVPTDVVYTPEYKALIDAARNAYDNMSLGATAQAAVNNYQTLEDAEKEYKRIEDAMKEWKALATGMPTEAQLGTEGRDLAADLKKVAEVHQAYTTAITDTKVKDAIAAACATEEAIYLDAQSKAATIQGKLDAVINAMKALDVETLLTEDVAIGDFKTAVSAITTNYDALSTIVGAQKYVQADSEGSTYAKYTKAKDVLVGLFDFVVTVNALPDPAAVVYANIADIKAAETTYTTTLTEAQRTLFSTDATYTALNTKYTKDVENADAITKKIQDFSDAVDALLDVTKGAVDATDLARTEGMVEIVNLHTCDIAAMNTLLNTTWVALTSDEQGDSVAKAAKIKLDDIIEKVMTTVPTDLVAAMDNAITNSGTVTLTEIENIKALYEALAAEQKTAGSPTPTEKYDAFKTLLVRLQFATYFKAAVAQIEANVTAGHFTAEDLVMINTLRSVYSASETSIQNAVKAEYDKLNTLAENVGYASVKDYSTVAKDLQDQIDALEALINGSTDATEIATLKSKVSVLEAAKTTMEAAIQANEEAIAALTTRVETAEGEIDQLIADLATANQAITDNLATVRNEIAAAKSAVEAKIEALRADLQGKIDALTTATANKDAELQGKIDALKAALEAKDTTLEQQIATLNSALTSAKQELEAAIAAAKAELQEQIEALTTATANKDAELQGKIDALKAALEAKDTTLEQQIATLNSALTSAKQEVEAAIEALRADLQGKIDALTTATANKDAELQGKIDSLKAALEAKDTTLEEAIAALTTATSDADAELQRQIDAAKADLQGKIDSLTSATTAKDAELQAAIDALKAALEAKDAELADQLTALKAASESADTALQAAIDALEKACNDADAALQKNITTVTIIFSVIMAAMAACIVVLFVKKRA